MTIEDLHQAIHAVPFRPFTLALRGGKRLRVPHPEFAEICPDGWVTIHPVNGGYAEDVSRCCVGAIEYERSDSRRQTSTRKATPEEVELALRTAFDGFGASRDDVLALAKRTGLATVWTAMRLAEAEGRRRFKEVERRALDLASLNRAPNGFSPAWLGVVRVYSAVLRSSAAMGGVLATEAGNEYLKELAGVDYNQLSVHLAALEKAGFIERRYSPPGVRKSRTIAVYEMERRLEAMARPF